MTATSVCFAMPEAAIGREDAVEHVPPVDRIPAVLQRLVSEVGPTDELRPVAR